MDCGICCNKFNKVTRKPVECNYCHNDQCTECIKTYMMGTMEDPSCMHCKHPWTLDFVETYLPKTWLRKDLQNHREIILFEREKAQLPETQQFLEQERHNKKVAFVTDLSRVLTKHTNRMDVSVMDTEMKQLTDLIRRCQIQGDTAGGNKDVPDNNEPAFVRNCPVDGCRGFIKGKVWSCGICQVKLCPKCEIILPCEGEHTCDPETLETVKLIKKDTKPCPNCKTLIFKVDGCNQMWCIKCHTTFDWKTGKLEIGRIHNPEYYRWIREHNNGDVPREPEDQPCNGNQGLPHARSISNAVAQSKSPTTMKNLVMNVHREFEHIQWVLRTSQERLVSLQDNLALRVDFLKNKINEDSFKQKLRKKEKQKRLAQAKVNIIELLVTVATEAFRAFIQTNNVPGMFAAINGIATYCEEQASIINMQFQSSDTEIKRMLNNVLAWTRPQEV
jgi:hypothetical protein